VRDNPSLIIILNKKHTNVYNTLRRLNINGKK